MTQQPGSTPPPAWYATGDGWERWWDGTAWTEHARPAAAGPAYAHWGKRVGATVVDGCLLIPFYVVGGIGLTVNGSDQGPSAVAVAVVVLAYVSGALLGLWNMVWRQGTTGYSVGKQVLGIRLVSASTMDAPGKALAFGRQFAHAADSLSCYLGYLWPLWDAKRQTFADKICSTVVIERPRG